ncbi:MAG: LCP family protein [Candidatus Merdivicinus sp.]
MAQRKRKLKKKKIALTFFLFALLVFMSGCVYYIVNLFYDFENSRNTSFTTDLSELGIVSEEDNSLIDDANDSTITNIALFGVDQREEEPCRSDVIMIATVDKRHNKIKLTSVMRDSYVPIDGYGQKKLNSAYFHGGPTLAVKTLNQVFDLDITDYVTVNFSEMAKIVDAVGGVEIDITEEERLDANHNMIEQAAQSGEKVQTIQQSGLQTLTGMQAVGYARIRNVGNSDFERTERQRRVMTAIFDKGKNMNPLDYPGFIKEMLPIVETSLDLNEILDMAGIMLRDVSMEDIRIPCNEDLINGGDIWVNGQVCLNYDLEASKEKLHAFIYQDIMPTQP